MASKKHFAGIDFQGGASIKVGGTAGNNQFLKASSDGGLSWASGTTSASGMGDVGITNYEGLIYSGITSNQNADFALAQSNGGLTVLNSKAGKGLYLRTEGGSSATDQIIIDGGTLSFQGSIGSEGKVLTVNSSNKAAWAMPVRKFTISLTWGTNATGVSFSGYGNTSGTATITHNLGTKSVVVSSIDVDGFENNVNAGDQTDMNYSLIVRCPTTNTITLHWDSDSGPNNSSGDNRDFDITIIG